MHTDITYYAHCNGQKNHKPISLRIIMRTGRQLEIERFLDIELSMEQQDALREMEAMDILRNQRLSKKTRRSIESKRRPVSAGVYDVKRSQEDQISHSFRSSSLTALPGDRETMYDISSIQGCSTCKSCSDDKLSLNGSQMTSFYKVWAIKDTGKKVITQNKLSRPSSQLRNCMFRSCGCFTRTHLKTAMQEKSHTCEGHQTI